MAKNNKKYETPEVKVIVMETAQMLCASGEIEASEVENATWD